jgi:antitoxin (DNA-binding transcriptional repressor) of toxin-antitoxin stability system
VAFGREEFVITKGGKPMASVVPREENVKLLVEAKGWLDEGDDFFRTLDGIVQDRSKHLPRAIVERLKKYLREG